MESVSNVNAESKVFVFVPEAVRLNFSNIQQTPPETKYNSRKQIFDHETVKKIVGGLYGRSSRQP